MSARDELTTALVNIPWRSNSADVVANRLLAAGYVKVSEAAIERAAQVLWDREMQAPWSSVADGFKKPFINEARAVVAALREEA